MLYRPVFSQKYLYQKNNIQNFMENNPVGMLRRKWKNEGKIASSTNFIGIIAHLSNFAFSVLWMMGEITHFLIINSAILEFKMSSIDKVLWKLVETWRSGALASGSDLNHVVSMVTALVLTSKHLLSHVLYPMIFLMSAWAMELFSLSRGLSAFRDGH